MAGPCSGGAEGTRTPDPLHAMQVRYQLRHSPKTFRYLVVTHRLVFPLLGVFGGAEGTRTPDPLHAMQVRYQLRHSPKHFVALLLFP